jgi:hypothetical protein
MAPPARATVLPSNAWAASEEPAATTTPAPSLPTAMDSSSRPFNPRSTLGAMGAETVTPAPDPVEVAWVRSAPPISRPRSEGLIGAASTRMTTSSSAGVGIGTSTSERSSVPAPVTRERSCKPEAGSDVMSETLRLVTTRCSPCGDLGEGGRGGQRNSSSDCCRRSATQPDRWIRRGRCNVALSSTELRRYRRRMAKAGIWRGAADFTYSPNAGISSAWAWMALLASSAESCSRRARNFSVPNSTSISGVATRL